MRFLKKKKEKGSEYAVQQLLVANTSHFLKKNMKAGKNTDGHEIA